MLRHAILCCWGYKGADGSGVIIIIPLVRHILKLCKQNKVE